MEQEKSLEVITTDTVRDSLTRSDITVAGEVESWYFANQTDYTKIHGTHFFVSTKRPILSLDYLQTFQNSFLPEMRDSQPGQLHGAVRLGFKRTSRLLSHEYDNDGRVRRENLEETIVNIYPHEALAKLGYDYARAKAEGRIQSNWNPIEQAMFGIPAEVLGNKKKMKAFVDRLREADFYRLIDEEAARRKRT